MSEEIIKVLIPSLIAVSTTLIAMIINGCVEINKKARSANEEN